MALITLAPAALTAVTPTVGDAAPEFNLPSTAGDTHSLGETLQDGAVVVIFYRAFW